MTKISVLLPNYNNGPYLKEALDSVFAQTHQNFIVYFVDDCSTDNSVAIAEAYKDDRIVIIRKSENTGIVDTMNKGLEKINTKYFIRMDGDDLSDPNRFERLIQFMENNPDIGVCSSAIRYFGKESGVVIYEKNPEKNKANLIFGHTIGHASSIFRTAVLKENNIKYQDRFWRMEDYYLFYQLKDMVKTSSISDVLYLYRRGDYNNNKSLTDKKNQVFRGFYKMILEELGVEPTSERIEMHLELTKRTSPKHRYKNYRNYIKVLINANNSLEIFPKKFFERKLKSQLSNFMFVLVDYNLLDVFDLIRYGSFEKGLLTYAVKTWKPRKDRI